MRSRPRMRLAILRRKAIIAISLVSMVVFFGFYFYLNLGNVEPAKATATMESIPSGAFIINMGVSPQTYGNSLKPYGMLYEMIKTYQIPVRWVINQSKAKDGIDFTYNGTNYSGGPFIIPAEYISATVASRIAYWQTQGVVGVYTTSAISVPVYTKMTNFPTVTIDNLSNRQSIIIQYYTNAGIPAAAYNVGNPATLTGCIDIWTNPHGDPEWATHSYLEAFVTTYKSWIFAQCHAVSVMESCKNPTGAGQLNFLSTSGLQCYSNGKCGAIAETHAGNATTPVTYSNPSEPPMQFLGDMYGATTSGSENWFIPLSTGQWNSNTMNLGATADGSGNRKGSVLVFGPAYNDPNNGYVMYEGGHDLDGSGTTANKVAAQRAYFNFILMGGVAKGLKVTATVPTRVKPAESVNVSANVTSGTGVYTYLWTSSAGGTFANPTAKNTVYKAPNFTSDLVDQVRLTSTDACGRVNFDVQPILGQVTLPISLISFDGKRVSNNVQLDWSTASEVNNSYFTIERSPDGKTFAELTRVEGAGNSTDQSDYSWTDENTNKNECYYRLSQTDFDGHTETFNTVFIKADKTLEEVRKLTPRPSMFSSSFNFEIQSETQQNATLTITTLNGNVVDRINYNLESGNNLLYYNDDKGLPVGIYIAIFDDGVNKPVSTKVMKQ
jgi:hypothetical protein